jgi:hypothetical protein
LKIKAAAHGEKIRAPFGEVKHAGCSSRPMHTIRLHAFPSIHCNIKKLKLPGTTTPSARSENSLRPTNSSSNRFPRAANNYCAMVKYTIYVRAAAANKRTHHIAWPRTKLIFGIIPFFWYFTSMMPPGRPGS